MDGRTDEEIDEKEHQEYIKKINHITSFLNAYGKEYALQFWGSGEGVSFVIKQDEGDYKIDLSDSGYLSFDFDGKEEIGPND